ncbi:non-ribosomal peptide synthetase [Aquimarina sp. Aq78]|uniref:non-ribosomal peptide synthetase n=1 Tax=Aquimarina sp. Aq78 TaxID=1191889 RepID=UPI000D0F0E81|nr:non-ribosomal peptide synthetase [Aquimarina sp. Aq78]
MKNFIDQLAIYGLFLKEEKGNLSLKKYKNKSDVKPYDLKKDPLNIISFLKENKEGLIEFLRTENKNSESQKVRDSIYKLSPLQEGMLFHSLYDEDAKAYIVQLTMDFPKGVDTEILKSAWNHIIDNHSILRSAFFYKELSVPVQRVYDKVVIPFTELDYSMYSPTELDEKINAFIELDSTRGFSFTQAPLMRVTLIKTGKVSSKMIFTNHHILFDGWSMPILLEELLNAYETIFQGSNPPEQKKDLYEDYIKYIAKKDTVEEERFWKEYLKNLETPGLLPFSEAGVSRNKAIGNFKDVSLTLDDNFTDKLRNYAQDKRLTVNTILQGVWALLLSKYTNNNTVVYGVTVSGRPAELENSEHKVGLYINTLPLCTTVENDMLISDWLLELQSGHAAGREHQYTSLSKIQKISNVQGDLFDSILVFENYPVSKTLSERESILEVDNSEVKELANYLLNITVNLSEGLEINFNYNASLLEDATIKMIHNHFEYLLQQIVNPSINKISEFDILTEKEKDEILHVFNPDKIDYVQDKTVLDAFEEQVQKSPDQIAIKFKDKQLTYQELDDESDNLANHLLSGYEIKPGDLIGVKLERSEVLLCALVAILKTGAAYVPIDSNYPEERISFIESDTNCKVIIDEDFLDAYNKKGKDSEFPKIAIDPNHLVYVMYTSGSTGKPKGTMIAHKSIVSLAKSCDYVPLGFQTKWLSTGSISFDATTIEFWGTLLNGGTLVLMDRDTLLDCQRLKNVIIKESVNTLWMTASWFHQTVEEDIAVFEEIKYLIVGGDKVIFKYTNKLLSHYPNIKITNGYGPTENTTFSTTYSIEEEFSKDLPIGKPVNDCQAYIFDESLSFLQPVGVVGELCLGGIGLAKGYLHQESLTNEKFIPNPIIEGERMYRTGDLVKWLPDGNIEFLGRKDNQVKIRGYRIELGEINNVIQEIPEISQSVVIVKEDHDQNKRLIGYVVYNEPISKELIQDYLRSKLPGYMVPQVWQELDAIPLTNNGKINTKALPNPDLSDLIVDYVAPRNLIEEKLAIIWKDLLGISKVGVYDNFFDLGGHSLLATRLVSALRKTMKIEIAIKDVFIYPTISELKNYLDTRSTGVELPSLVKQDVEGKIPLSFSQERLWFLDQLQGSLEYHVPIILRIKGTLDISILEASLKEIVKRHESLRTIIKSDEGVGYQEILSSEDWWMNTIPISSSVKLENLLSIFVERPFDLSKDYMCRACAFKLGEQEYVLAIVFHHISSDGWSEGILINELTELYTSKLEKRTSKLKGLSLQYKDYAIWQRKYLEGKILKEQLSYWERKLEKTSPLILPSDYEKPAQKSGTGAGFSFELDKDTRAALEVICKQEGATLFMVLIAAFKVLLYRYSGQSDICIGTPVANRTQEELEGIIGFFINTLVLRSNLEGNPTFLEFLKEVKNTTLEAYDHQLVPFEKIVDRVVDTRDMSVNPLFQVMFVLQNITEEKKIELDGLSLAPYHYTNTTSKFDIKITAEDNEEGLSLWVEYATDLFKEETTRKMICHYQEILTNISKSPETSIDIIPLLTEGEKNQLLEVFNSDKTNFSSDKTIVDLFEEQCLKNEKAVAVVFEGKEITYRELREKSNQLAHLLGDKGITKDTLVGVCLDRSPEMITAIMAVLKAGGAYVPIDSEFPMDRISYIIEDAEIKLILCAETNIQLLESIRNIDLVALDRDQEIISSKSIESLNNLISLNDLAYVIYTSGSTGRPKGVMIEHKSILDYFHGLIKKLGIKDSYHYGLMSTTAADLGNTVLFGSLLTGGTLHTFTKDELKNPVALQSYFENNSIDFIKIVPSHWLSLETNNGVLLPEQGIIFGGSILNVEVIQKIKKTGKDLKIINHYGPTETTIGKLLHEVNIHRQYSNIPIGKPFSDARIYILGPQEQLVPIGVVGELCISGPGLARGYLKQEDLTSQKFIDHPFIKGEKLYKTGDLAKWLPDGTIDFIGRKDHQVKVRGYRIELGEIETVLSQIPEIVDCCVITKEGAGGDNQLIAYVVTEKKFNNEALQNNLQSRLPEYMIPRLWMKLDEMPLTNNGKVDKNSLPDIELLKTSRITYVAPRNKIEKQFVEIWQNILEVDKVGIHNNFFSLGGHSLLAMKLVVQMNNVYNTTLSIRDVFECPTIAALSDKLPSIDNDSDKILIGFNKEGYKKPIFCAPSGVGTAIPFYNLADLLGEEQPFYAFQCPGIDGITPTLKTVEQIASLFITEMQKVNPYGPYCIGGYSFGGKVALEMALQLHNRGYEVSELLIFDAAVINHPLTSVLIPEEDIETLLFEIVRFINLEFGVNINLIPSLFQNVSDDKKIGVVYKLIEKLKSPFETKMKGRVQVYINNCTFSYYPQTNVKLNTQVLLFRSKDKLDVDPTTLRGTDKEIFEKVLQAKDFGWQEYTNKEVKVYPIKAGHTEILSLPHVIEISQNLNENLKIHQQILADEPSLG